MSTKTPVLSENTNLATVTGVNHWIQSNNGLVTNATGLVARPRPI